MTRMPMAVKEVSGVRWDAVPAAVTSNDEPLILRQVARDWDLVAQGRTSDRAAIDHLRSFDSGKTVGVHAGDPAARGRYGYTEDATRLNFEKSLRPLRKVLDDIEHHLDDRDPPPLYVGSTTIDACLPGLRTANDIVFEDPAIVPLASIWLGNPSVIPTHYDAPNNLACSVVGARRFTLFPPDQIDNLYPGPLDPTPGGQPTAMVDIVNPDFDRYPRFRDALAAAQVADLEPGDALFIPSMWWHQVDATGCFNVLMNYWWSTASPAMGNPVNPLYHALLSLRDRPEREKQAWRAVFEYYVFGPSDRAAEHLPEAARGVLGPIDDRTARQLRAYLLNGLNR